MLDEFGDELAKSKLISVVQNATVVSLLEEDQAVGGCIIEGPNGLRSTINARIVVLCGGAVGNARLLDGLTPASGINPVAKQNNGKWLQEHPHKYRIFECLLRPEIAKEVFTKKLINQENFVSFVPPEDLIRKNKWPDFNFQLSEKEDGISPEMSILAKNYRSLLSERPVVFEATLGMEQFPRKENSAIKLGSPHRRFSWGSEFNVPSGSG